MDDSSIGTGNTREISLEHPVASESKKVLGKNKNKKHLMRVYIKRRQATPKELPIAKAGTT